MLQPTTATDDVLSGDINNVVKQLGKGGGLQDPRARLRDRLSDELAKLPPHFEHEQDRLTAELRDLETPLVTHVQGEVRRAIARLRLLPTYKQPDGYWIETRKADGSWVEDKWVPLSKLTLSKFRKAAKALREVAFTEPAQQVLRWLEGVRQEPPERANEFHYHCAAESYDLLRLFSKMPATRYEDGPFVTIAVLLCAAAGGSTTAEAMRHSCALVLRERR